MFRDTTIERLKDRVTDLNQQFAKALSTFERENLFTGPSVYFHIRALDLLRQHGSAADAVKDDAYLEALYATLTAWGLHRMGPGNAKLLDLEDIRRNLIRNSERIHELEAFSIFQFGSHSPAQMAGKLAVLLERVRVSQARTFLVSTSKVLHHLLPGLVPPVDNEYTLSFFFHSIILDGDNDQEVFETIFPYFHQIARKNEAAIRGAVGRGPMNTSETKIIDNAIVGYCRDHDV